MPGPADSVPGAATDDLDARCRGIGTSVAPFARAAHRTGRPTGAGVPSDVPVAPPVVCDGVGSSARQASPAR